MSCFKLNWLASALILSVCVVFIQPAAALNMDAQPDDQVSDAVTVSDAVETVSDSVPADADVAPSDDIAPADAVSDAAVSDAVADDAAPVSDAVETVSDADATDAAVSDADTAPSDAAVGTTKQAVQQEPAATAKTPAKRRKPIKIAGKKTLPLRLLTRPFANVYAQNDANSKVVQENVPTFSIFFAYSSPETTPGWFEVGTDKRGGIIGWMQADDVIEWKQYLTLSFTNPADRSPTLFFADRAALTDLMDMDNRSEIVQSIRTSIDEILKNPKENFPPNFVIAAMEPPDFVDMYQGPYLLPVLSAESMRMNGKLARVLEVASAVKGSRKSPAEAAAGPNEKDFATDASMNRKLLQEWQADIVFVIDATSSMQPYIDGARAVVRNMAQTIKQSDLGGQVHFGLVAYRDSVELIPAIEYTSKIFCNLQEGGDLKTFDQKISQVMAAQVGSQGFDEDVWAGLKTALEDKAMQPHDNASLFIIHIGDASSHEQAHPMNTTGLVAQRLRELADNHKPFSATIASLHLITPNARKARNNQNKAKAQFKKIVNSSGDSDLYFPVKDGDPQIFEQQAQLLLEVIVGSLKEAKSGSSEVAASGSAITGKIEGKLLEAANSMKGAIRAAQLEYLGSKKTASGDIKAPRDIKAWTVDRDLENPKVKNLKVNLLITKNNLDQLKKSLEAVLEAGTTAQVSGEDFFDQLQSVMATATSAPEMVRDGLTLQKFGLMPEFLDGLPYKSEILAMTNDAWFDMPPDAQNEFLAKIKSKITLYETYYNNQDKWIQLNPSDEPGEWVMPMDLNSLP